MNIYQSIRRYIWITIIIGLCLPACHHDQGNFESMRSTEEGVKVIDQKGDASAEAIFLEFEFEGVINSLNPYYAQSDIDEQLLYTVGQLNGDQAVSRLDKAKVEVINEQQLEDGSYEIAYHAKLLVAWKKRAELIDSYTFILPYKGTHEGRRAFTEAYMNRCVSSDAHDVDLGSMWYYYRPHSAQCPVNPMYIPKEGENISELPRVISAEATVTTSEVMTTGKYPEYHKVWEDEALRVVVIFGKADEDGPVEADVNFQSYKSFFSRVRNILGVNHSQVTPPVEGYPLADQTDLTIQKRLDDGRSVHVTLLLVDNVLHAGEAFDSRYHALSEAADLIIYNGHAGLGANIRALAQKGRWLPGQYSIVFMNGCDTYAYVDQALFDAHAAVNPDDSLGSKYVDIITNAMPSYFFSMSSASYALFEALLNDDRPLTYEQIFTRIDPWQVVLVTGEADNEFIPKPTVQDEPVTAWTGLDQEVLLTRGEEWRLSTPTLPIGTYRIMIEGTGDVDLYVRQGLEPTQSDFDCRPFSIHSSEACEIHLESPNSLHIMLSSWTQGATVMIRGGELK